MKIIEPQEALNNARLYHAQNIRDVTIAVLKKIEEASLKGLTSILIDHPRTIIDYKYREDFQTCINQLYVFGYNIEEISRGRHHYTKVSWI